MPTTKPAIVGAVFLNESRCKGFAKAAAWLAWFCILSILALPSILYAVAQSSPSHNTLPLTDEMLQWFHRLAPLLTVVVDVALADEASAKFSAWTGLRIDHLLMTFRLFSSWLLALLTTVVLDENCLSGWKMAWSVCQEASSEKNDIFTWHIYSEEILNTQRDICQSSDTWWSDGRCSRAIVGNLTPFLLKKLLLRSAVRPLVYLLLWRCSRLHQDGQLHLMLFHLKTSGFLAPVQQLPMLTTQMDAWQFLWFLNVFTVSRISRGDWICRVAVRSSCGMCNELRGGQIQKMKMYICSWINQLCFYWRVFGGHQCYWVVLKQATVCWERSRSTSRPWFDMWTLAAAFSCFKPTVGLAAACRKCWYFGLPWFLQWALAFWVLLWWISCSLMLLFGTLEWRFLQMKQTKGFASQLPIWNFPLRPARHSSFGMHLALRCMGAFSCWPSRSWFWDLGLKSFCPLTWCDNTSGEALMGVRRLNWHS